MHGVYLVYCTNHNHIVSSRLLPAGQYKLSTSIYIHVVSRLISAGSLVILDYIYNVY